MKCAVQIYMVLGGFHVYKSVFLGWVVGRFNIAVNGEHNCGVLPTALPPGDCLVAHCSQRLYIVGYTVCRYAINHLMFIVA